MTHAVKLRHKLSIDQEVEGDFPGTGSATPHPDSRYLGWKHVNKKQRAASLRSLLFRFVPETCLASSKN